MGLAALHKVVLGTLAFWVFWVLAVFPSFKLLPIGRTAGALAGAVLMVVFQIESPKKAYEAVDLSILGLLFGTMVVGVYLEKADMFRYLSNMLSWRSKGGKDLLCRVCVLSAISSALFTNDTCCIVLTEFVLKLCRQKNLPPKPFLIALASSANIGSSATPIGNPQNLVIAVQSGISFGRFLLGLLPSMAIGVLVNMGLLLVVYWKQLSPQKICTEAEVVSNCNKSQEMSSASLRSQSDSVHLQSTTLASLEDASEILDESHPNEPVKVTSKDGDSEINVLDTQPSQWQDVEQPSASFSGRKQLPCLVGSSNLPHNEQESIMHDSKLKIESPSPSSRGMKMWQRWKKTVSKVAVYFVTIAMLAALLYGLDLSWTALTAAVTLMAIDFCDAGPNLEKVSYALLVFFAGMFITVDGFNAIGIPSVFWDAVEPYARINKLSGVVILTLVVIVLSNVASNVPTVLLLGSRVAQSARANGASVVRGWLILAWTSTVAGNLTLIGSAANLIVSEQARKAQFLGYNLTFFSHLVFGFPSALIVIAIGLPLIRG